MPLNPPSDYSSESDWMSYCVPIEVEAGHEQDQAVAICGQYWRDRKKMYYKEAKLQSSGNRVVKFVASDETIDGDGDIVRVDGWDLREFKKNPVLLWGHDKSQPPIGRVDKLEVRNKQLLAETTFMESQANPFAEQVYQMIKGGFVRAVSVGYLPIEYRQRKDAKGNFAGYEFLKQKLKELSVVTVPSNPNAVAYAKSLGLDLFSLQVNPDSLSVRKRQLQLMKMRINHAK